MRRQRILIAVYIAVQHGKMAERSKALESGVCLRNPVRKGASSNLALVILQLLLRCTVVNPRPAGLSRAMCTVTFCRTSKVCAMVCQ